jgi:hypothetical protein
MLSAAGLAMALQIQEIAKAADAARLKKRAAGRPERG